MKQFTFDEIDSLKRKVALYLQGINTSLQELSPGDMDTIVRSTLDNFFAEFETPDTMAVGAVYDEFVLWFTRNEVALSAHNRETMSMTTTVNYGAVTITFSQQSTFIIRSQIERFIAEDFLLARLAEMQQHYEAVHLAKVKLPPAIDAKNVEPVSETETWDAARIVPNIYEGKRFHRVFGGRWSKFGVPIYEEVLAKSGLPLPIPDTGLELPGYVATCQLQGGKPKRVTSLVKEVAF